ncbi:hypothetical protein EVJ58_g4639 [Rhodofomes roseus]|uniref:Protein kinase domain-containing protein n=1 Tax=Rhodofomes roseus TaxID=34475 RepID=A0A4Y9YG97_9APHY|nr:hypothetical protein EVJ58_g4639 [Rhodofomes roseus]
MYDVDYSEADTSVDLRHENILMRGFNDKIHQGMESIEAARPSARKIDGDRVVYETPDRVPFPKEGFKCAVLCDYGEARCSDAGNTYTDDIQPFLYRAPELALGIPWSYPVDIWNAGVMLWHLFENKSLFNPYNQQGRESNGLHIHEMMEVMGDPSPEFVRRSIITDHSCFDENGLWKLQRIKRKKERSLESLETQLEGEEKAEFLRFMRRMLQWEPEKRATAAELLRDPWFSKGSD